MASKTPLPMPSREEMAKHYYDENKPYTELAEIYGVSISTICKWMKKLQISAKTEKNKADTKFIRNEIHKRCYGPTHPEGGAYVPLSKFWKNPGKSLGVNNRCAQCVTPNSRVKFTPVFQSWVISIYRRLGTHETCRRLEIHNKTLRQWMGNIKPVPKTLQRHHAVKIVKLISELKETGEVRHKDSIHRGAKKRGEPEKKVKSREDLLHSALGDADTHYRRHRRANNPELVERENAARRRQRLTKKQAA